MNQISDTANTTNSPNQTTARAATERTERTDWKPMALAGAVVTFVSSALAICATFVGPANGLRDTVRDTQAQVTAVRAETADHETRIRPLEQIAAENRADIRWIRQYLERRNDR